MPIKQCKLPNGGDGWQWGDSGKCYADRADAEKQAAAAHANGYTGDGALALDKASVRTIDQDGHLHIAESNISKATVNPYVGREIPDWKELGLDGDRIYYLLRDPVELQKAVATFDGKPLLFKHRPVDAEDHAYDTVVGAVYNPVFDAPFLKAELVVWPGKAIDAIEDGSKQELSCGYRYKADMTPGVYQGQAYDGVMREIQANHVALVAEGRAGPDVVVGDQAMNAWDFSCFCADEWSDEAREAALEARRHSASKHVELAHKLKESAEEEFKNRVSPEFHAAHAKYKAAGEKFTKATAEYRARKIGDKEYLAAKKERDEASKELDKVEEGENARQESKSKSKPKEEDRQGKLFSEDGVNTMANTLLSRKAAVAQGALLVYLRPKLAQDAKIDLTPALAKITAKNFDAKKPILLEWLKESTKGKLAKDMALDDAGLLLDSIAALDIAEDEFPDKDKKAEGEDEWDDEDDEEKKKAKDKKKSSKDADLDDDDEEEKKKKEAADKRKGAKDADPDLVTKPAMDAAIAARVKEATSNVLKTQREIREAERAVRPYVGDLAMAHDSADEVYRTALDAMGIKTEGINELVALKTILEMQPKASDPKAKPRVTMDAAGAKSFADMFPDAARIRLM